jgi:hypothetical protein
VLAERFFEQRPKRGGVDGRTREARINPGRSHRKAVKKN